MKYQIKAIDPIFTGFSPFHRTQKRASNERASHFFVSPLFQSSLRFPCTEILELTMNFKAAFEKTAARLRGIPSYFKEAVVAAGSVYVFSETIGMLCRVDGCSMYPTLNENCPKCSGQRSHKFSGTFLEFVDTVNDEWCSDWVFVSRLHSYIPSSLQRGDIVVLKDPQAEEGSNALLVKRISSLEDDLVINMRKLEVVKVQTGHCWVEGDCTPVSRDSRTSVVSHPPSAHLLIIISQIRRSSIVFDSGQGHVPNPAIQQIWSHI